MGIFGKHMNYILQMLVPSVRERRRRGAPSRTKRANCELEGSDTDVLSENDRSLRKSAWRIMQVDSVHSPIVCRCYWQMPVMAHPTNAAKHQNSGLSKGCTYCVCKPISRWRPELEYDAAGRFQGGAGLLGPGLFRWVSGLPNGSGFR